MDTFIKTLTGNWHVARWMRLVFSIVLFIIYFIEKDSFALLGGMIFGFQAVFNMGCCGASGCATQTRPVDKVIEVKKVKIP